MPDTRYYVAVDFGSESMAACYVRGGMAKPENIDLQARGAETSGFKALLEPDGKTVSPRLRTRIAVRPKAKGDKDLTDDDLDQESAADLGESKFQYFHVAMQGYGAGKLLPNLKLLYQAAVSELLPDHLRAVKPERILGVVVLQILNCMVFTDKKLVADGQRTNKGLRGSHIHLLLTIPNVYSTSHAGKLRRFIAQNLKVGNEPLASVETVYESDAIAHYLWWRRSPEPPSLADAIRRIEEANDNGRKCNIITVDIGRGTTDVSFFTFENSKGQWTYELKARTGRAHGGGRLTYLIAKALEEEIEKAFDPIVASFDEKTANDYNEHRFQITRLSSASAFEALLMELIEQYIETIKLHWDENLNLNNAVDVHRSVDTIANAFEAIYTSVLPAPAVQNLKSALSTALKVPVHLQTSHTPQPGFFSTLLHVSRTEPPAANTTGYAGLAGRIAQYVRENSDDVLTWMEQMVASTEKKKVSSFAGLLAGSETIVLVAGQASQFPPLAAAIRKRVTDWNLNADRGGNLVFLAGAEAKYACCHGAVMRHGLPIENARPGRVMGTYGFLSRMITDPLKFIDMTTFQVEDEKQVVPLNAKTIHSFVYSPRYFGTRDLKPAEVKALTAEGASLAYLWEIPHGGSVEVTNVGEHGIELRYLGEQGEESTKTDDAAFGDVETPGEDIYTRTWPEVLQPQKG